jgi:putative cell wall-binding protein
VTILTTGPIAGDSTLEFQVTGGSTTGPTTITLSNLAVDVPQSLIDDILGGFVSVTYGGTNPVCSGGATTFTATKAFSVSGRIYGVDADATAAQAFAIANPVAGGGNVGAVLATSTDPYDALSASYLAGQTSTGILLTGTGSAVDPQAMTELRLAGVETVYAVGGPNVISPAQIAELESTPVYVPGGVTQVYDPATNDVRLIEVQWIYGATADDTAAQVAQYVGDFPIGNPVVEAAYNGQYNDTAGSDGSPQSTAPDTGVQTAIIATDTGFQDAASASVMAYHNHLPLILSPANALSPGSVQALDNDGIQQALVMGGPDVINDSVVTQLEGMGISVLRIAGSDYTDTSAEAAKFELNQTDSAGQLDGLGYSLIRALVPIPAALNLNLISLSFARGDFYTDAIVSSQINSFLESPELLTENPTTLGTPVATFLATEGNPTTAYGQSTATGPAGSSTNQYPVVAGQAIFGGPLAFNAAVETTIAQDLGPDQLPIP